jgi:hypothetical protein
LRIATQLLLGKARDDSGAAGHVENAVFGLELHAFQNELGPRLKERHDKIAFVHFRKAHRGSGKCHDPLRGPPT